MLGLLLYLAPFFSRQELSNSREPKMICDLSSSASIGQRWVHRCFAAFFFAFIITSAHAQSELPTTWRDDYFPQFHITITPEDLAAVLEPGSTAKVAITFIYQGETYAGTIRQRLGNSSLCGDKRQFRLDFASKIKFPDGYVADRFETDRGNCYTLHEWVAWKMMDQAAQKRPDLKVLRKKSNVVAIYFNGELYHVQTLLEDVNKDLLEPQLGTRKITIYENGCYGLSGTEEMGGFCSIYAPAQIQEFLQIPSFLYTAAVVQMLGGNDNYPSYPFNHNFVQETETKRIWFMPDDMDSTIDSYGNGQGDPFQTIYTEDDSQRHFTELVNDPEAGLQYRGYLRELLPLLQPDQLKPLIAAKYAQVRETLLASPELPLGTDWYDYVYLYELPIWVDARYAFLNSILEQNGGGGNKSPVAVIASLPASMQATDLDGVVVQLNGTASTDPDNDALTYQWKVDGQEVGTSAIIEVKLGIGAHVITLSLNDGRGGVGAASATLEILPPSINQPPVAVIASLPTSLPATDADGVQVQLNGAASNDPENDTLSYGWKVDEQEVGSGAVIDLKLAIGAHVITLFVSDGQGGVGIATANVEVLPLLPLPTLTIISVSPSRIARDSAVAIQITGTGFSPQANVYISGSGVTALNYYNRSEDLITAYVRVQPFATSGVRDVIVVNPDGQTAILRGALTVQF
jgi:CotH kinase protein/IPT/TIG domain